MISASKGNRILRKLQDKKLCSKIELALGKKGTTKFLVLTERGYEAIGMSPRKALTRGGGPVHDIFVHLISTHLKELREDWKVVPERNILGKWTDIVIELENGELIAVECALTPLHEEANIRENLKATFSLIIVGCRGEKVQKEVRQIAEKFNQPNKIGICLLSELLTCNKLSEVFRHSYLQERGL